MTLSNANLSQPEPPQIGTIGPPNINATFLWKRD